MTASQTLLSRLNTHNYHNPLDGTLNRLANKLSITTSLCPSSRTLKAVDCGGKKTILVTKMKPSFGILQSTVNWLMPETFTPQSFLFTWHWNEDLRIHKIPTPEQQLKCIHRISRIQCYILCSIFSSIMLTNREQQEGNGVNGYHVKIHLVWMVFKWLLKNRSNQHDEPIRIPSNYLELAQRGWKMQTQGTTGFSFASHLLKNWVKAF